MARRLENDDSIRRYVLTNEDAIWAINKMIERAGWEFSCRSVEDPDRKCFVDVRMLRKKNPKKGKKK